MDFTVTSLDNAGQGSLRWAIDRANKHDGFDRISIDSSLRGESIRLGSDLAIIQDRVAITGLLDASGKAAVAINFNGHQGLTFKGKRAEGSHLEGFALTNASSDGLTLDASRITVQNNLIGVELDGITGAGNRGHGIKITESSHRNIIGDTDPLTGIPLKRQASNVIGANKGDGIHLEGSDHNWIANNRIGTSADGQKKLGNGENGIKLTQKSDHNRIGGTAHKGNDPTQGEFKRPGQGNLISGNGENGVLINDRSRKNILMGNFIGTNARGVREIGNADDGVEIANADQNSLIGTTRNQSPFIYYNVVSGNGGNGLRVLDSEKITIHANFFGIGSDNLTPVSNKGDGALIEGRSDGIQYGGVIPLGNVNSYNDGNGINVTDKVRNFVTFNTFAGLSAFGGIAPNKLSGIRISSSGGDNQIRTNVMSGNLKHGLHITGQAKDIWVDPNIIGLNTSGTEASFKVKKSPEPISWGNRGDGIRIDDQAENIRIAGRRLSVIPQNTISNNEGYGIKILDNVKDVYIDETFIGLSSTGKDSFGNKLGGIYSDKTVRNLEIGRKRNRKHGNQIVANGGNGIQLVNPIGSGLFNNQLLSNKGSGVQFQKGNSNSLIGNTSSSNQDYGFSISSANNTQNLNNKGKDNGEGLFD